MLPTILKILQMYLHRANTTQNTQNTFDSLSAGVAALASGWLHTCVVLKGGGVNCWSFNEDGQIGTGTLENHYTPMAVTGLDTGGFNNAME